MDRIVRVSELTDRLLRCSVFGESAAAMNARLGSLTKEQLVKMHRRYAGLMCKTAREEELVAALAEQLERLS